MINWIYKIDYNILKFVNDNFHNKISDFIFPIYTTLNNYGLAVIFITIILLIIKKYRIYGMLSAVSLGVVSIVGNNILKNIVQRVRPSNMRWANDLMVNMLIASPQDFSFPSGHTASFFALSTVLFFMNRRIGTISYIFAAFMGFSRIFLFVHYPSDVIAGIIFGVIVSTIVCSIFVYTRKKLKIKNKGCGEVEA